MKGVFITTSTFTPQAREFAQELAIELIDGERLRMLFQEVHLLAAEFGKRSANAMYSDRRIKDSFSRPSSPRAGPTCARQR